MRHNRPVKIPVEQLFRTRPFAREILTRLAMAGHEAMLVGGVVRDAVLAKMRDELWCPQDVDIATSASPDEVRSVFADRRVLAMGEAFGVLVVLGTDEVPYEVATYRTEGAYLDGRRPARVRWGTLEEDVRRRDFTVNGLAASVTGEVMDHVGGLPDLANARIRTIGPPAERLAEDYLRMLRAVRFACQLDFTIDGATAAAVRRLAGRIQRIAQERIRDELLRLLGTPRAARGVAQLRQLGLLGHVMPEIAALDGVPQPVAYHPEGDVLTHTLAALEVADGLWDAPLLKLGILFHDVGKPEALARSGGERMSGHCHVGASSAAAALRRLRLPGRDVDWVAHLVAEHMRVGRLVEMGVGKQLRLLTHGEHEAAELDALPERYPLFADLLRLLICDAEASVHRASAWAPVLGATVDLLDRVVRLQGVRRAREMICGDDLLAMGEPPGPRLGRLLEVLHDRILAGDIGTREEALAEARRRLKGQM